MLIGSNCTTGTFSNGILNPKNTIGTHNTDTNKSSGIYIDMGGFPRPDTSQMLPFKPKLPPAASYHPVCGGNIYIYFFNFIIIYLKKL